MARILVIVDPQNDFAEGGSLAVAGGLAVGERITDWVRGSRAAYDLVVVTRDWHENPGPHFASTTGAAPNFTDTWPDHCVAGSPGAAFIPTLDLDVVRPDLIVSKGQHAAAYSGFEGTVENGGHLRSVLDELVGPAADIDVCGLATDYCVKATAIDAINGENKVAVLLDLCAGVAPATTADAVYDLAAEGVIVTTTAQVASFRSAA